MQRLNKTKKINETTTTIHALIPNIDFDGKRFQNRYVITNSVHKKELPVVNCIITATKLTLKLPG